MPWKPGQSGNPRGRPKGSRHKIAECFLRDLLADYEEHGAVSIAMMRQKDVVAYVKTVASLLPKQIEHSPNPMADLTDQELEKLEEFLTAIQGEDAENASIEASTH